jgi:hypothetical protein
MQPHGIGLSSRPRPGIAKNTCAMKDTGSMRFRIKIRPFAANAVILRYRLVATGENNRLRDICRRQCRHLDTKPVLPRGGAMNAMAGRAVKPGRKSALSLSSR